MDKEALCASTPEAGSAYLQPEPNAAELPELELIQSHMAQKQVLRGEVGCACVAREVSMGERPAAPQAAQS